MKPGLSSACGALPAWLVIAALAVLPAAAAAQDATDAAPDSAALARAAQDLAARQRASWLADRVPLKVGDLLTVVVDEQTAANEKVSRTATGSRSTQASIQATLNTDPKMYDINTGLGQDSRDVGEANRSGDLTAVMTVRVTAIEPGGAVRVEGKRKVTVDGREQNLSLSGVVRPQDVMASHYVLSNRIAEAVIEYKGKKIGPRTGIVGKVLGMLWP